MIHCFVLTEELKPTIVDKEYFLKSLKELQAQYDKQGIKIDNNLPTQKKWSEKLSNVFKVKVKEKK